MQHHEKLNLEKILSNAIEQNFGYVAHPKIRQHNFELSDTIHKGVWGDPYKYMTLYYPPPCPPGEDL